MLSDVITKLIRDEQSRQDGRFITGVDIDSYLSKLAAQAEILSDVGQGRCRGLVAFYCNDVTTAQAFITLVVIHPLDRGRGFGRALTSCVLDIARQRGFTSCRLEVASDNAAARAMYEGIGFRVVENRGTRDLMEVML